MECAGACLSGRAIALEYSGSIDYTFADSLVPMSIEDFEEEVRHRAFFKEGDRPEVVRMYRDGLAAFTRSSEELAANVQWADPEKCARLLRVLPRFERLRELRLQGYPPYENSDERIAELDVALDALARRGCRVFAGMTLYNVEEWLPDAGPGRANWNIDEEWLPDSDQSDEYNPAHNPPWQ